MLCDEFHFWNVLAESKTLGPRFCYYLQSILFPMSLEDPSDRGFLRSHVCITLQKVILSDRLIISIICLHSGRLKILHVTQWFQIPYTWLKYECVFQYILNLV